MHAKEISIYHLHHLCQQQLTFAVKEHIISFEVAMQNSLAMNIFQAINDVNSNENLNRVSVKMQTKVFAHFSRGSLFRSMVAAL